MTVPDRETASNTHESYSGLFFRSQASSGGRGAGRREAALDIGQALRAQRRRDVPEEEADTQKQDVQGEAAELLQQKEGAAAEEEAVASGCIAAEGRWGDSLSAAALQRTLAGRMKAVAGSRSQSCSRSSTAADSSHRSESRRGITQSGGSTSSRASACSSSIGSRSSTIEPDPVAGTGSDGLAPGAPLRLQSRRPHSACRSIPRPRQERVERPASAGQDEALQQQQRQQQQSQQPFTPRRAEVAGGGAGTGPAPTAMPAPPTSQRQQRHCGVGAAVAEVPLPSRKGPLPRAAESDQPDPLPDPTIAPSLGAPVVAAYRGRMPPRPASPLEAPPRQPARFPASSSATLPVEPPMLRPREFLLPESFMGQPQHQSPSAAAQTPRRGLTEDLQLGWQLFEPAAADRPSIAASLLVAEAESAARGASSSSSSTASTSSASGPEAAAQLAGFDLGPHSLRRCSEAIASFTPREDLPDPCVICLEVLAARQRLGMLPCGHCFHRLCAVTWLRTSAACPLCKYPCGGMHAA
eukprot:TRINITY_DN10575_c0_g1_i4.p1 TRINITY_DN10575_c0_g1~~TRINITY_DN10575_c0_g1_i4.p1  ORF type:complete len:525 (+),score=88.12 TRINITY_DN10575_c0_g1_i4:189-1763(+)